MSATPLLWLLVLIGSWNAINLMGRIYYNKLTYRYMAWIILGAWSALILISNGGQP